mmetsp:Transcript_52491/g.152835  ORF Transcript_52491/g.152835 Transcript_52491/m.152835 type:complete len:602 (-) Transcript_52491:53-1858(-)
MALNKERATACEEDAGRVTLQLKLAREQLDKKSELCDGLAAELRRLEVELEAKSAAARESRDQLRCANSELRAARQAGEVARAEHDSELATLKETNEKLRREALDRRAATPSTTSAPGTPCLRAGGAGCDPASNPTASWSAASPADERSFRGAATPASHTQELEDLRVELARERELHQEAVRLLRAQRVNGDVEIVSLEQELANVAAGLEQREEEVLSIQFDMVTLQNRLRDQVQLVNSNAEAFQQASEELADKEEALQQANARQEELLEQINSIQGKVNRLSEELETSRAAYQALEEQTRAKVSVLQADCDALAAELHRVRAESDGQLATLRAELQKREEAADALTSAFIVSALKEQLRPGDASMAGTVAVAVAPSEEPPAEDTEGEAAPSTPPRRPLSPSAAATAAAAKSAMEDRAAVIEEQLATAHAEINDLKSALARSRLIERQAVERAQEYRTSLELYREFGAEFFADMPACKERSSPSSPHGGQLDGEDAPMDGKDVGFRRLVSEGDDVGEVALRKVLISIELDLGAAGSACMTVAPWQTTSDFEGIVSEFLQEHKVKPLFADALIAYLEEVEAEAKTFPVYVQANLSEIFSAYG